MPYEILLTETFGSDGSEIVYVKPPESNKVSRLDSALRSVGLPLRIWRLFKGIILPKGYPESVSEDYAEYQIWDTVQAFSSTLGHTLTTHAVLVGVGVGDSQASALSASVTWIFKDGVGMLSRILFAWGAGTGFDSECKKWRMFADVMNDLAMLFELAVLPLLTSCSFEILCLTSAMKALVGVAGGATRAAVTQHQAVSENTGDVSAKDSSQETCVNLLASLLGVFFLSRLTNTPFVYVLFALIMFIHLYANYMAVRALKFKVLNPERFHLLLCGYLTQGHVAVPHVVAKVESVNVFSGFTDVKLSGFRVKFGASLQGLNLTSNQLRMISSLYKDKRFMLVQSTVCVRTVLSKSSDVKDYFQAYFHALMLAIASSSSLSVLPSCLTPLSDDCGLRRFLLILNKLVRRKSGELLNIEELIEIDQFCSEEFKLFWKEVSLAGWNVELHQLHGIDAGWRASWGSLLSSQHQHTLKQHPL